MTPTIQPPQQLQQDVGEQMEEESPPKMIEEKSMWEIHIIKSENDAFDENFTKAKHHVKNDLH